ncbi:flagellar motor switch protein FliG [Lacisediminihabitans changchengi]|uniref:Flagellar motor switch protein FliG n=1 Tax=Lacisediminihabitans changchengi TaxID=2787634 RepID=A0A934SNJ8_9MICO|nr:flagellar motor switch protein FliG [Lacisediminihabitans changchengi]MBK4348685.1 flagellar motor switch protein FliG [Lacisediminihabitans changchengi]
MSAPAVLSGTQKVAVVLMNLDPIRAAEVMKQFTETEAEEITAEIIRLRRVDSAVAERTILEFHELTMKGGRNTRGGRDFASSLLEASFGSERAAGVLGRVASSMGGRAFEFLDSAEPGQLVTLLDGELPQTIALVLAHLRPEHASPVLAGLDDDVRSAVAQAIGTMGSAAPEAVRVVADTLKVRASAVVTARDTVDVVGGVQPLVEIINRADVATERALLESLDVTDPALAEEVRSRLLTFADIVKFEKKDVQQVLRGIDASVLALAMKGSTEAVIEVIRANISERLREILEEEVQNLGPVRMKQIEEARAEIVRAIRDLEAQGAITIQRGDDDQYVA